MSKVSLRPMNFTDAPSVQLFASDAAVAATCNIPQPYPQDGGLRFVENAVAAREEGTRYPFAILYEGGFVGTISLNAINREEGSAELDYALASSHWNRGIMTEAARQAIQYAFDVMGLSLLRSGGLAENRGTARVLEKNGFVFTEDIVNDGHWGQKFLGRTVRRYERRKDT